MQQFKLEDSFGRTTTFTGELLLEETTDTEEAHKPQWVEMEVWRTEGGSYVLRRTHCYRIVHTTASCHRAEGYDLIPATEDDTHPCRHCNPDGVTSGLAQNDRVAVDAFSDIPTFIQSFMQDGRYSNFARSVLANLSDIDEDINQAWNFVHVP